jgi:excisionase family DNA binding protein
MLSWGYHESAWRFQGLQMKHVDSPMGELFRHLRRAIDVLEQIALHPYLSSASERPPRKLPDSSPAPPTSSFEKRAYTIKEVGALTGVSRTMIYHAIKIKELRAVKCGHKTMIRAQDLQAWIDAWRAKT